MKSFLYSVVIGNLVVALTARAQEINDRRFERGKPQHGTAAVQKWRPPNITAIRGARSYNSTPRYQQRSYSAPRQALNIGFDQHSRIQPLGEQNFAVNQEFRARRDAAINSRATRPMSWRPQTARDRNVALDGTTNFANRVPNVTVNRERNLNVNRYRTTNEFRGGGNVAINPNRNFAVNNTQDFTYYRGRNVGITNNWRSDAFRGPRYSVFRNYERQWHDRSWWRSHYDRIIFVNGGWYYWNAGYWFPAWGYDPYVTYVYDGPIYAYNGLTPADVTVDVQQQLAAAGYYDGPIDGVLGPMTREAIADFQADNGLVITSAIDEPTLATLGLV